MRANHVLIVFLVLATSSCVTTKKLTYLQQSGKFNNTVIPFNDTINSVTPSDYRILPNDNIYIRVVTPDPQWSNMFNALPATVGVTITPESAQLISYPVAVDGTIDIPYAGKFSVAGKTLSQIKKELELALVNYIKDAAVTVRLVNNYVSIVGEVRLPGRYPIYKDGMNVFEVFALAGDMIDYSNRKHIRLIRRTATGNIISEFSLLDRSIMTSEYFYVMPNDVIYAPPRNGKFFGMATFPYEILLSSITSFLLILSFVHSL